MRKLTFTFWSVREQAYRTSECEVENVENWQREIDPAKVFYTGGVIGNIRIECEGRVILDQIGGRDRR